MRFVSGLAFVLAVAGAWTSTARADDDAERCKKAIGKDAVSLCTAVIESGRLSGRSLAMAYVSRGLGQQELRAHRDALNDFNKAIAADNTLASAYINRGVAYQSIGEYSRSIADFDRALALEPKFAVAHFNKGIAYSVDGDYALALASYSEAIKLDPAFRLALGNRCYVKNVLSDYDGAIQDCSEALRLGGDRKTRSLVFFGRAIAYSYKDRHADAIEDFSQAIVLAPDRVDNYLGRAQSKAALQDFSGSLADYESAVLADPKEAEAWNGLCWMRAIKNQLWPAREACDKAIELDRNNPYILDSRAFVYLKQGDYERAIVEYNAALSIDPKQPTSLYGRGVSKLRKGDADGGREDMQKARRLKTSIDEEFRQYGVN